MAKDDEKSFNDFGQLKKALKSEKSQTIENDLKKHWRTEDFKFMGKFQKGRNGKTCAFVDLRNTDGDLLYFPRIRNTGINGGAARVFSPREFNLEVGEYYQFEAEINSNEDFVGKTPLIFQAQSFGKVSGKIKARLEKEELVKQIFKDTAPNETAARNQANAIKKVTEDAYEEDERFIFELIQNADDAGSVENPVNISFYFKFGHIIVNHNGTPFSDQDVISITGIGYSSPDKSENIKKTGYKGIGFKAVFIVSDKVAISSGGYTFEFTKDHPFHRKTGWNIESIPWEIQPIWLEKYRLPYWVDRFMPMTENSTSFLLEVKRNADITPLKVEQDAHKIFNNPRFSLFLRSTSKIEYSGIKGEISIEKRFNAEDSTVDLLLNDTVDSSWLLWSNSDLRIPKEVKESIQDDSATPKKLKEAEIITLSFAAKVKAGRIIDLELREKVLFTYLPTSVTDYDLPYLVNGDFLTILNRQSIKTKKKWNEFLFEQIGYHQFSWAIEVWNAENAYSDDCLKVIKTPFKNQEGPTFDAFNRGFEKGITELSFVPDYSGQLRGLDEIIIDETGIANVIGIDLFLNLFGDGKFLVIPQLKSLGWLKNELKEREQGLLFSWTKLKEGIDKLSDWLIEPNNNIQFLDYLVEKGELNQLNHEQIFLDSEGKLQSSVGLYKEFPDSDWTFLKLLPIAVLRKEVKAGVKNADVLGLTVYSGPEFIEGYIIDNKSNVDALLDIKDNSIQFYQYLAKYSNELSPATISGIKWFKFHDSEGVSVGSFENEVLYFPNQELKQFIDKSCLPDGQFRMILDEYLNVEHAQDFWASLGVIEYDANMRASFFIQSVIEKLPAVNSHLDALFGNDEKAFLSASYHIIEFYILHQENLSQSDLIKVRAGLGTLHVLTKNSELKPISDCFLSKDYTGSDDVDQLLGSFPELVVNFISEKYLEMGGTASVKLKKTFMEVGCKHDHLNFIRDTLFHNFDSLNGESLIAATRLLFNHRVQLKDELSTLTDFPVVTDNGIIKIGEATFSNHYLKFDKLVSSLWTKCESGREISSEYTKTRLDDWIAFFVVLGLNKLDESSLVTHCIDTVVQKQPADNSSSDDAQVTAHLSLIDTLIKLHDEKRLEDDHYYKLQGLKLLADSEVIEFDLATDMLLSSVYKPKIDFQAVSKTESVAFLSPRYVEGADNLSQLKGFFSKIGVQESFTYLKYNKKEFVEQPDWLNPIDPQFIHTINRAKAYQNAHTLSPYVEVPFVELILELKVNAIFWKRVVDNERFRDVIFAHSSYTFYENSGLVKGFVPSFIGSHSSVPDQEGVLRKPLELYCNSLSKAIKDPSIVSSLEIDELIIQEVGSLSELLGFKQNLDLAACIFILKREEPHAFLNKHGVIDRMIELFEMSLSESDSKLHDEFVQTGNVPNQINEWVPIKSLFSLEDGFELGISRSEWLIHDSFEKLADAFKVRKLSKTDFNLKSSKTGYGPEFKLRLLDRSKFIAFVIDQDAYEEKEIELQEKIQLLTFHESKKISLEYANTDAIIEKSDYNFFPNESELHYRGTWSGVRAAEMFKWLVKYLGLGNEKLQKAFEDIVLAQSTTEVVSFLLDNNLELPDEWLPKEEPKTEPKSKSETDSKPKPETKSETKQEPESTSDDDETEESGSGSNDEEHSDRYSEEEAETIKKLFGDSLSDDEKFNENMEAHIKALHYFKSIGYDVSEAESNFKVNLERKFLEPIIRGDEKLKVMCRKAGRGLLYFGAHAWVRLEDENTHLYILTGKSYSDCILVENQSELETQFADYWVLRREKDEDLSPLAAIIGAEEQQSKLQVLFSFVEKKYSGIFSKWENRNSGETKTGAYGNEDED